jgi:predicted XRE-type DNA-binding protein
MAEVKRLLMTAVPKPDESLLGYIIRLTEINDYDTPSWIVQLAGVGNFLRAEALLAFESSLSLLNLSKLTGVQEEKLTNLLYRPIDLSRKKYGDYLMFDAPVPKYVIRPRHTKICPPCLRDFGYIRKIWDLTPITACPIHKCLLLEVCPDCQRHFSWMRNRVSYCECGCDWRDSPVLTIDSSQIQVSRRIHILCKLPVSEDAVAPSSCPIQKLDLKHFLSAIFFIASQYLGGIDTKGKSLWPSVRNEELHLLLCKAFSVFEDWPNNYFEFLDWRKNQVNKATPAMGLRGKFEGYKSALYIQLISSQLDFMRDAFEVYLTSRWDGGYTSHLKRLGEPARQSAKYASRREAKKLLKISFEGIDRLIAAGKIKAIVRPRGRGRLILIDKESLKEFHREHNQSLYQKQVVKVLGIPHKRVLELIDYKLLNPLRGPNIDGCRDRKFSNKEVHDLLTKTRGKARAGKMGVNITVSLSLAFRNLIRNRVGMGKFVKAILDGEISPCGVSTKTGLGGLLFLKEQISTYVCKHRREQTGETFSVSEAAELLEIAQNAVYFFVRKGILSCRKWVGERYSDILISKDDLNSFNSTYVLPAKVAAELGTVSTYLTNLIIANGIHPISGPKIDGGYLYIFRKADLNKINIVELISLTRVDS